MSKLNFEKCAYEWLVHRDDTFTVEIRGWTKEDGKSAWNVYANIFDTHPYFNDIGKALDLHFHGGVTYEQRITRSPAQGIRYSWQRDQEYLKFGSDYQHLHDDWFASQNPALGIPHEIKVDATQLVKDLLMSKLEGV